MAYGGAAREFVYPPSGANSENVMIGGVIIGRNYPAKVLLRTIGPSLPVEGNLQDPTLELVDSNGSKISNDNWRETKEAEIIATTVPPRTTVSQRLSRRSCPALTPRLCAGRMTPSGVALVRRLQLAVAPVGARSAHAAAEVSSSAALLCTGMRAWGDREAPCRRRKVADCASYFARFSGGSY